MRVSATRSRLRQVSSQWGERACSARSRSPSIWERGCAITGVTSGSLPWTELGGTYPCPPRFPVRPCQIWHVCGTAALRPEAPMGPPSASLDG